MATVTSTFELFRSFSLNTITSHDYFLLRLPLYPFFFSQQEIPGMYQSPSRSQILDWMQSRRRIPGTLQATSYIPCVARAISLYTSIIKWGACEGPATWERWWGRGHQSESEWRGSCEEAGRLQSKDIFCWWVSKLKKKKATCHKWTFFFFTQHSNVSW